MSLNVKPMYTLTPGLDLDKNYSVQCTCGASKSFGYMWLTAERYFDLHRGKCEGNVTLIEADAPIYSSPDVKRKMTKSRISDIATSLEIL